MGRTVKVVGLGGSLPPVSSSLSALRVALDAAAEAGAATELLDLRELDLPMYMPRTKEASPSVHRLCEAVYAADGLLWSSPLYHGTISGSFKNALDWLELLSDRTPAYLTDKIVGLISTARGAQGLQAVNTMKFAVRALRGWAVPLVLPIPQAWRAFDPDGHALDPKIEDQLGILGREAVRAAGQFAQHKMTTPEAEDAEASQQPISDQEIAAL